VEYARDRVQSRPVDGSMNTAAPIIHHPDVKRMLMTMRAFTEGCRAMAITAAAAYDAAHAHPDPETRAQNKAFYEFMVPLVKGYSTEMSLEVTSLGVQVHGGMGFIEETGAAQIYRDARILPIYEGTNGIQALDLVTRKLPLEGGKVAAAHIGDLQKTVEEVRASNRPEFGRMGERLGEAVAALAEASRWMSSALQSDPEAAMAGATPYLRLFGLAAGGVYLARGALASARRGAHAVDCPRPLLRREPRHHRWRPQRGRGRRRRLHLDAGAGGAVGVNAPAGCLPSVQCASLIAPYVSA
jgi:hypothetical protein